MPQSLDEYLRHYPRACAAIVAFSHGAATPRCAAYVLRDAHERAEHDWSWLEHADPHWSRRILTRALRYRHNLDGYHQALARVRMTDARAGPHDNAERTVRAQSGLALVITPEGFINLNQACELILRYDDPTISDRVWAVDVLLANGTSRLIRHEDPGFDQLIEALEDEGYTISTATDEDVHP